MTTRANVASSPADIAHGDLPLASWLTPAWTLEECLKRIETLGQRIQGHIGFVGQLSSLNGTSAEAKEKAVRALYQQLVTLESQLSRIVDNVRLA